jgi:hypothetical protein
MEAEAMGRGIELGEDLVGTAAAELLAQPRLDVGIGTRRHLILQALQLAAKVLGEEVRHDADELADLDEEALQLDHRALHAAGVPAMDLEGQPLDRLARTEAPAHREPQVRDHDLRGDQVRLQQPPPRPAVVGDVRAARLVGAGGPRRSELLPPRLPRGETWAACAAAVAAAARAG